MRQANKEFVYSKFNGAKSLPRITASEYFKDFSHEIISNKWIFALYLVLADTEAEQDVTSLLW